MSDYHTTIKIQQGRLKAAMMEVGIRTASELSRRSGVSNQKIGELLNFKKTPRTKSGKWRKMVIDISRALGADPSYLFPEHLDHEVSTNSVEFFADRQELSSNDQKVIGPADECMRAEMEQAINDAVCGLPDRERCVLIGRICEGKHLAEIGRMYDVTPERVRQIESSAMRKMRHPSVIKRLEEVWDRK